MKILLAGGAGYIGSLLAPTLLEMGYEVDVIDLLWFGNHLPPGVRLVRKDLFACGEEDLAGYDAVVFLAGLSNDPMAEFSPAKNFIDNGALPSYVAYIAKRAGVRRFVYASSCSVYGYTVDRFSDEESPVSSSYPYGISKLQGERGVLQMQDERFSVIAMRQGTVCGHSPRMRFDLIVNTMFKAALTEGRIVINNPSIWRPVFDIRDAASAFVRAIQASQSVSGVFNVTSGNYTVAQVGELVKHEIDRKTGSRIRLEIRNLQDFRDYKVSIEKARTCLGFSPLHSVSDTIDSLFEHREEYGDFGGDGFYNIVAFRKLFP